VLPLVAADPAGVVVYGHALKILAPGLRQASSWRAAGAGGGSPAWRSTCRVTTRRGGVAALIGEREVSAALRRRLYRCVTTCSGVAGRLAAGAHLAAPMALGRASRMA
jgi:hypothetical protein